MRIRKRIRNVSDRFKAMVMAANGNIHWNFVVIMNEGTRSGET
jgi:hypothetical protein